MKASLPFVGLLYLCLSSTLLFGQDPPSGFASVTVSGQWNEVVGLTFTEDGLDMFVWERAGKLWVVKNGQRSLLLDITEEVGGWHDHGFLGFALHPHFDENGQIYLLYLVDRHHLKNFGTAAYNPSTNEFFDATIGRLTRYTTAKNGNGYTIVPGSRKVLIGETITTGIPVLSITHSTGSLVFGTDHTLLISTGDGASPYEEDIGSVSTSYYVNGLADGIIRPKENVGAFRSQMVDCYNGKILRIDPETGAGLPSNPFYDPADPNSRRSKVWALGLRNPFRMSLKPETGSHNPADGNPGILYVGDVGWNTFEEVNVVDRPGLNFGWPIFEGQAYADDSHYSTMLVSNPDAPNPLYQVNGCNRQYFYFQDLIKQETPSGTATFPNPCNTSQNISNITTFVHKRPLLAWRHCCEPSRVATFNGQTATTAFVRPGASPVPGPEFQGRSSTGGIFYTGADFAGFQNSYFFGDYTAGWIRNITVDGNDRPIAVRDFVNQNSVVVAFAKHPTEEGLYYVNFPDEIRKIYFSNNRPPVAIASSDKQFGAGPLQVQFQGSSSKDFENQPLTYEWNFGDGTPLSNVANPSHTFNAPVGVPTKRTVTLKVTDNQGASNSTTLIISINNTPPEVEIVSPVDNSKYSITAQTTYTLRANVADKEHSAAQLTYRWQTILHHADHEHPSPPESTIEPTATISPLGCDGQEYFYRITLTVTDDAGASTSKEVRIYPDCNGSPSLANPIPDQVATAGIPFNFTFTPATFSGSALNYTAALSNGNALPSWLNFDTSTRTFTGTPAAGNTGTIEVRVTATNGNGTANDMFNITVNASGGTSTFYRAINLNGAALLIDGNNWEASASAAGFSFTNGTSFANQAVTLQPATDANRTTMIRSSIYGGNIGVALANVPNGNYQVYLYVWEDNNPETFTVRVEGAIVQANFNSGTTGSWAKLGPYAVNLTDGTINVGATGGSANFSGLEVWSMSSQVTQPSLGNPIADQIATVGIPYNFTFAPNTFSGSALTYTAALSNGNPLPSWLSFDASTRTFTGTPAAGNTGTIEVRVTATNGGGTANDLFNITVNASGGTSTFYRAINLNGAALVIDGNNWEASASAPGFSFTNGTSFANQAVTLQPATDANRTTMIRSSIYGGNIGVALANVPNGNYQVYLYVWEDNNPEIFTVRVEGAIVQANFNSGTTGSWTKLGPYAVNLTDGTINVGATGGSANFSGLEVWSMSSQVIQPSLVNPIADQVTTVGIPYNFAFAANTFSGSALTYTAALSNGNPLPSWLSFDASTRTFTGTPAVGNTGTIEVRVTATNGAGTANDLFNITVNASGGTSTFYRAINLNGAALVIDGNNWEASASAPGFSFTNGTSFANQAVTLQPATDANRTTMIRSSIYGGNIGVALANVPNGNYQVYLYVWEDNNPEIFTVRVEGAIVQANFNSGTTGSWTKLGPYAVNLTDGTINVGATGGSANFSGLEIWSVGSQVTQPSLVNPIADQVATVGIPYNFAFAANTFSGSALTYSAALSNGNALPVWLNFDAAARTFTGTPGPINTGTIEVRVTATNGGGTANDLFNITVNLIAPLVANPIPDQVATVGQPFAFMVAANTFSGSPPTYTAALSDGSALPAWLNFDASTRTFTGTPAAGNVGTIEVRVTATNGSGTANDLFNVTVNASGGTSTFYRAINLNGSALVIDGNNWEASASAPGFSFTNGTSFANQAVTLQPATDANRTTMIRSSIYGGNIGVALANVPNGNYQVYLYVWEDNNPEIFTVRVEGVVVQSNFNSGTMGSWTKLGPYAVNLTDGTINVGATGGSANFSGLEVWSMGSQIIQPSLVNPIADQVATVGLPYNFTFASNTFSGSSLNYAAALSNGNALPAWLTFTASTRTFSGTPAAGNTGIIEVRLTATNGGGTANDLFNITVNASGGAPTFYRAINLNGPALVIDGNNWEASATAPSFSYTNASMFSNQAITLQPSTDVNRANMIRSSFFGNNVGVAMSNVPNGNYQVYLYLWEDNFPESIRVTVEGTIVNPAFNSGTTGSWTRLGPYAINLTDGTINAGAGSGGANLSGFEVWRTGAPGGGARMAMDVQGSTTITPEKNSEYFDLEAYPNPFSDRVKIIFTTREDSSFKLLMFDAHGVEIRTLSEGSSVVGKIETLDVESGELPDGVYLIRLVNGTYVRQVRVAIVR